MNEVSLNSTGIYN